MTYNTYAVSNTDLIEVQLYDFELGTTHWRYTNADRDIDFEGVTYTAIPISDGGVKSTSSADSTDSFKVTLPAELPPHQLFRTTPPSDEFWLTVRRKHATDGDAPIFFLGTVLASNQVDDITAEMAVRTLSPTLRRGGLRCTWQKKCPHMLFGPDCKVNKADYVVDAVVSALTGTSISAAAIAGHDVGWFDGGWVEWDRGGATERRPLHAGGTSGTVQVLTTTEGLTVGQAIRLYPGCDLLKVTCNEKFNNTLNFGGFDHMIEQNPFDGHPLF